MGKVRHQKTRTATRSVKHACSITMRVFLLIGVQSPAKCMSFSPASIAIIRDRHKSEIPTGLEAFCSHCATDDYVICVYVWAPE